MIDSADYVHWRMDCGLQLLVVSQPHLHGFASTLALPVGWRDDPRDQPGIAHVVEHLCFEGDNHALAEDLSRRGLDLNGHTDVESTVFAFAGHSSLLDGALELAGNMLRSVPSDPEVLVRELEIVAHELASGQEMPFELASRQLLGKIVGDPAVSRTDLLDQKKIGLITPEHVAAHHLSSFDPEMATLIVVSPFEPEAVREKVHTAMAGLEGRGRKAQRTRGNPEALPAATFFPFPGDQVLLDLSFLSQEPERYPASTMVLLSSILGGGQHSLLYREIRSERGLAYMVGCDLSRMSDLVMLSARALVNRAVALPTLELMLELIRRVSDRELLAAEVELARERLLHWLHIVEDSPTALCEFLTQEALTQPGGQPPTPRDHREALENLSLDVLTALASDLFSAGRRLGIVFGGAGFFLRRKLRRALERDRPEG